jgi:hypothetical protein
MFFQEPHKELCVVKAREERGVSKMPILLWVVLPCAIMSAYLSPLTPREYKTNRNVCDLG